MLYSALLVAAATFTTFVSAQNSTIGPCCNVPSTSVPQSLRSDWCEAQRNTCPEICGGFGKLKSGGNTCDPTTLTFNCTCSDNTSPNMSDYQQSVPGQMCRFWFELCINASGTDRGAQEECKSVSCGNRTTTAAQSSAAASSSPTTTGGGGNADSTASATSSSATSAQSTGAAAALALAREYGTPILAGGLAAVFGLAL